MAGRKPGIGRPIEVKRSTFSAIADRPVLRRGRRQGWKRIGRRPDASDPGGPKARPTPGPERRPDRRQERRLEAYRTPNVPEQSGRGEQGPTLETLPSAAPGVRLKRTAGTPK